MTLIVHWSEAGNAAFRGGALKIRNRIHGLGLLLAPIAGFAQPPAGPPQAFQKVCGACHSIETVTSQRRTRAQWQESITSMIQRGAKATEEEFALILDYLASQYGPDSPAGRGGAMQAGGRNRGPATA